VKSLLQLPLLLPLGARMGSPPTASAALAET
jgi:hypothetical protein